MAKSPTATFQPGSPPLFVRAFNTTARAAHRVASVSPSLDAQRLLRAAEKHTGLRDYGEPTPYEPLAVLTNALSHEAGLHEFGRFALSRQLRDILISRLKLNDWLRRNPHVEREPIREPVFIVGFPRTGTTLLQWLMSHLHHMRPLHGYENFHPIPPRRRFFHRRDPRISPYWRHVKTIHRLAPALPAIHPMRPDGPEEGLVMLARSLVSWFFLLEAHMPSYRHWLEQQHTSRLPAAYRLYRRQLQMLQWQSQSPASEARWLLKCPLHLDALDTLLTVFPDARIIHTHRPLRDALPSTCSLHAVMHNMFCDRVDPAAIGEDVFQQTRRVVGRIEATRARLTENQVFDVPYHQLTDDPAGMVGRIADWLDRPLRQDEADRIEHFAAERPLTAGQPQHRYSLEQFGLSADRVDEAAAAYERRFLDKERGSENRLRPTASV